MTLRRLYLIVLCFLVSLPSGAMAQNGQWSFGTSFENVRIDQDAQRIVGIDKTVATVFDSLTSKQSGDIYINYETKDLDAARAEVVEAPGLDSKQALHLVAFAPNVRHDDSVIKTRIQMDLAKKLGFGSFVSEVSVFLPTGMAELNHCPYPITWLTLHEFWNAPHSQRETTFRITVGLWKSAHGRLHFGFKAQDYIGKEYIDVARGDDEALEVPINQWFRLRTEVAEGDSTSGYFCLTLTVDGQEKVLYERTIQTMSSNICAGLYPRKGYTGLQPIKLYTSAWLTEWMANRGVALEAYFTDWEIEGICR